MSDKTGIEWCDSTWNPIRGCSRVSEGCRNCYAEKMAARFSGEGMPYEGLVDNGKWNGKIKFVDNVLQQPLLWKRPRKIFVNSMSDLFHQNLDDSIRFKIFEVMSKSPQHIFQILTKRPKEMLKFVNHFFGGHPLVREQLKPLPNVWLGVSVEDQKTADERIPILLETPASVRWVSAEPLLGRIKITNIQSVGFNAMYPTGPDKAKLGWVVCGGESGPGARPMNIEWARSLRDQCKLEGVPFLFKQWGEYDQNGQRVGKKAAGRELDVVIHDGYPI